ncbi:MAG: hypothetical protein ACTHW7_01670 [Actinomycetaceae bacterium]
MARRSRITTSSPTEIGAGTTASDAEAGDESAGAAGAGTPEEAGEDFDAGEAATAETNPVEDATLADRDASDGAAGS